MRQWGWGSALWMIAMSAHADYTVPVTTPVDLTELTTEAKALVPALSGMSEDRPAGTVTFYGTFPVSDHALLNQAVAVHDAQIRQTRRQQRDAQRRQKRAAMRQKLGLTDQEWDDLKEALQ